MSGASPSSSTSDPAGIAAPRTDLRARHRGRRALLVVTVVVVLVAAAGGYVEWANPYGISLSHPLGGRHPTSSGPPDNGAPTATRPVTRQSLSQTTTVFGTLGYTGNYTVITQRQGTFTKLPVPGKVITQGKVLYRIDGTPVVLLYGSTPAYRTLAEGATQASVVGQDVRQLNHDLVDLGYLKKAEVAWAWNDFSWATKLGVERLQDALGVTVTGTLQLGEYVFLPAAARVTTVPAQLGGPAGGPVLAATSTTRQVTVQLDAGDQSEVKVGDRVTITLPNNQTTPGRVSSVGKVATLPSGPGQTDSGGSDTPQVTVRISPSDPKVTGTLDQAPVQVAITNRTVHHVLAVPVEALVALSGGGYAVEVVDSNGTHRLVRVHPGLFDDAAGLVQVSGSGLTVGQHVVVPAS